MTPEQVSWLRQGVYRFLGAGFSYPNEELLGAGSAVLPVLDELGLFKFAYAPELARAVEELGQAGADDLATAHTGLFEAGVGGAACSPHESAFTAEARTGEVAGLQSELKRTILRYGLRVEGVSGDMVDHVSTELQVMAMLARLEGERRSNRRPIRSVLRNQIEFLHRHLLSWVPSFCEQVGDRSRHPFYASLAMATQSMLVHDRQLLPVLIDAEERAR